MAVLYAAGMTLVFYLVLQLSFFGAISGAFVSSIFFAMSLELWFSKRRKKVKH